MRVYSERKSRVGHLRDLPASVIIIGLLDTPANYRSAAATSSRAIFTRESIALRDLQVQALTILADN